MNIMLVRLINERDIIEGYYQTIESAINSFIQLKIKTSQANSIQSLLNELKLLQHALNTALQPLKLRVEEVRK